MAETLGSLCDKLTIVKLKQYHTGDTEKTASLLEQQAQLIAEIDTYLADVSQNKIPMEKLTFAANKVYNASGNQTRDFPGSMGDVFAQLAAINCELWHEQEKVYEFEKVAVADKDQVVKKLAVLNLERTKCIDKINELLVKEFSKG
ncbi:MAG: hypothetical protein LBR56_02175 [Sporomusaceae bacterium]|jgi:hypothetical protein|nr:hypothetical protein [Sporomusaceae bacterium]